MLASLALALVAVSPVLSAASNYAVYSDGLSGSLSGKSGNKGGNFHASAFLSRGGCSSTAKISSCFAADVTSSSNKELETKDYKPWISGGVGTNQRALILSPVYKNTSGVVTHKVRFHISSTYTAVPVGGANAVTIVDLRNSNATKGMKALDIKARTFTGEETSGTFLYVSAITQDGQEAFPTSYPLADAVGKTLEVTYKLGVNGATVDSAKGFVASVTAKFVNGGKQLFDVTVTKTLVPKGAVDPSGHRLIYGVDRRATSGQKALKVWVGDHTYSS